MYITGFLLLTFLWQSNPSEIITYKANTMEECLAKANKYIKAIRKSEFENKIHGRAVKVLIDCREEDAN